MIDAFANLASNIALKEGEAISIPVCQRWVVPLMTDSPLKDENIISILYVDTEDWRQPLIDYLEHGKLPNDPRHLLEIR